MTHICMNGAPTLRVTDFESFYRDYINKVKSGIKLYLIETKTPLFRFFVDLDYTSDRALTHDEIIDIVKRLNAALPGRCVCSLSAPVSKNGSVKTGIHIHWPDCIVTKNKALRLRSKFPEDLVPFIDEAVYKGSGLRMLWSYKRDGSKPYVPFFDMSSGEYLDQQPSVDMLKLFTIKTEYTLPDEQETEHSSFPVLEDFIQRCIPGYENTKIKKRSKNVFHTDSKYCARIHREHKSNHVYFVLNGVCLYQMCHDTECKNFKGRRYRLTPSALKELDIFQ